jgi:cobalt-zinc-cadmium efflux system outer membrane protein
MRLWKYLLIGLLMTPCLGESSLPSAGKSSELSDYLRIAALNNPGLKSAFHRWQAVREQEGQVKTLPDPRLSYRYFIEEVETRVGAQRQSVELSQTFPWFGKLELAGEAASRAALVERAHYESARRQLIWGVKQAYYEFYYLARSVAITEENVQLLKHLESVVRTRYKGAAGSHPDMIRAQVELGTLEDRLRMLKDMRHPVAAQLNAHLNRPIDTELPWPGQQFQSQVSIDEMGLMNVLIQTNSELMAMDYQTQQKDQQLQLARKQAYPDITLGVQYIDTANSTGGRRPSDDGKNAVAAMLSINLPLWKDKYDAEAREAQHRYYEALHNKKQRSNSLRLDLQRALQRLRDGRRKITLYQQGLLPKAREGLKVTEASFRAGQSSFLDLIDAQQIYLEFELAYEEALVNHETSLAKIEWLTGKEFDIENE